MPSSITHFLVMHSDSDEFDDISAAISVDIDAVHFDEVGHRIAQDDELCGTVGTQFSCTQCLFEEELL